MISPTVIKVVRLREARVVRDTLFTQIKHLCDMDRHEVLMSSEDRAAMAAFLDVQEIVIDLELQLAGA